MSPGDIHQDPAEGHDVGHSHGSRRGYLIGFGLSAILTAIPFWLAMSGAIADPQAAAAVVVAFALAQIGVHTAFFLHVTPRAEGGWTLLALIFTVVIVAIVIAGSLWIMYHLSHNMMPMGPEAMPASP